MRYASQVLIAITLCLYLTLTLHIFNVDMIGRFWEMFIPTVLTFLVISLIIYADEHNLFFKGGNEKKCQN